MRRLIVEEPFSRAAIWSRRLAVFAAATALVSVFIARLNPNDPAGALAVFGAALAFAFLALVLAGAAAAQIWRTGRRGVARAVAGFTLALALITYPAYLTAKAMLLPEIHDISTDSETAPNFMISTRAREARAGRTPPSRDADVEAAQKTAYPDVQPAIADLEPEQAYRLALRLCKELGWRVVDSLPPNLRGDGVAHIDATDRSFIFGLIDDIAIRIRPLGAQTRIDIRSVSRVGKHDFGANANRIRRFLVAIRDSLQER